MGVIKATHPVTLIHQETHVVKGSSCLQQENKPPNGRTNSRRLFPPAIRENPDTMYLDVGKVNPIAGAITVRPGRTQTQTKCRGRFISVPVEDQQVRVSHELPRIGVRHGRQIIQALAFWVFR